MPHQPFLDTLADTQNLVEKKTPLRSWVVVLTASFFFFYEFIQMNMFNTIAPFLMHAFHTDAAGLGKMSSFYFIANVVFLLFAGALLDRCATRLVILVALAICIIGTALFSYATNFYLACFFRFLTGIGSAFCFLSVIRLSSRWFPPHRMALITGLIVTIAMIGGWVSQAPMTLLVQAVDWRHALRIDAIVGVGFFLLIWLIVQDYPEHHKEKHLKEQAMIQELGYVKSARMAFLRLQNWLGGLYVCLMNLPVGLLGGLWGVLYLTHTHHLTKLHASEVSSMLFLGTILGSPIAGWFSDKIRLRKPPMLAGALISLGFILFIMLTTQLGFYTLLILFFCVGVFTSTQIIGYPLVAENSKRIITAMSVSVVNISVQGGIGVFQPIFGYLMDKHAYMRTHHISSHFVASDFQWAMWIFPIGFVFAILAVLFLRETRCEQVY